MSQALLAGELGAAFLAASSLAWFAIIQSGARNKVHWIYIVPSYGIGIGLFPHGSPIVAAPAWLLAKVALCTLLSFPFLVVLWRREAVAGPVQSPYRELAPVTAYLGALSLGTWLALAV